MLPLYKCTATAGGWCNCRHKQGPSLAPLILHRLLLPPLQPPQGPLCRFGDTAANAGMLSLLAEFEATRSLPLGLQTVAASAAAGCWRLLLLPLDAVKTMMQV